VKFGERLTAFVARLTPTQKAAAGVLVLALAVGGTVGGLVAAAHDEFHADSQTQAHTET